jgi:hypothetical protein
MFDKYHGLRESPEKKDIVFDKRLTDQVGVKRRLLRDGMGREAWWWTASIAINGEQRHARFSIEKYGDRGAHSLAKRKREQWEIEARTLRG